MFSIEKKMTFEAAHFLDNLSKEHPCRTIHGHSYKLFIKIYSNKLNNKGFVLDFNDLREFKTNVIDKIFDHTLILTEKQYSHTTQKEVDAFKMLILPKEFVNSSAECICMYIHSLLVKFFEEKKFDNYTLISVKLFETENNCATYIA